MTVALPTFNNIKLAQKTQNYSSNFKTILSPLSSIVREGSGTNMSIRVAGAVKLSQPPYSSLSRISNTRQTQDYHSRSPHQYPHIVIPKRNLALGTMLMFVLFVLSSSTSSVTCTPLGSSSQLELTSIPQEQRGHVMEQSGSVSSAEVEEGEDSRKKYMIQQQGRIYLPSLIQDASEIGLGINLAGQRQGDDDFERERFGEQQLGQDRARYSSKPLQKHHQIPQNEDESSQAGWETVIDPHLYLLTEWNTGANQQQRMRRNVGPSLSIVNPLDVLRQRLLLEIHRRKMRQSHNQIMANAEILKNIGRRRRR